MNAARITMRAHAPSALRFNAGVMAALISSLLADLIATARQWNWRGAAFTAFGILDEQLHIEIVAGTKWPTIDDLRAFRDRRRSIDDAEQEVRP